MRSARVLLTLAALAAPLAILRPAGGAVAVPPAARYAVIVVLDGARPDYFRVPGLRNLHWLARQGVTYDRAFVGQEIAITPTSHATIGTGLFPKHHGVQGFVWRDPTTGRQVRPGDLPIIQTGALERVMSSHHVTSIASAVKARYPKATILAASGHKCYAADAAGTAAADYIICSLIYHDRWVAQAVGTHRPPPGAINNAHWDVPIPDPHSGFAPGVEQWNLTTENTWTTRYALWVFKRAHHPRVMIVNLAETDVIGHFDGLSRKYTVPLMRGFDRDLGMIIAAYRRAHIFRRTTFIVTADHAMTAVHWRLPISVIKDAIRMAGAKQVYIEGDTGAAVGIDKPWLARRVALNIAHLGSTGIEVSFYKVHRGDSWTYGAAWVRPGLPRALVSAYTRLMNTMAAPDGPDVFAVYEPHTTTGDRIARGFHWTGGHLGPEWDDQHIPLVIAGAGIRRNAHSVYPARLVDLAPTVERLLGTAPQRVDGIVLADALRHPTEAEVRRQHGAARSLDPLVRALQVDSEVNYPQYVRPGS